MKNGFVTILVGVVGFALIPVSVSAQGSRQGSRSLRLADSDQLSGRSQPSDRMNQLEAELVSLRTQLDDSLSVSAYSGSNSNCCFSSDCGELKTGLSGGFEVVWLKPHFSEDTAFVISDMTDFQSIAFDNEYELTPRVWLAHTWENGFGVRLRYWNYDKNAIDQKFLIPAGFDAEARIAVDDSQGFNAFADGDAGELMLAKHGLELHTLDLEMTNQFCLMNSQVVVSGGLRYLSLRNVYRVAAIAPDLSVSESMLHNQRFEGFGPMLAMEVNRPLGDSGLSLYTNLRGAILFGDATQKILDERAGASPTSFRQNDSDKQIAIGELGIGVRYSLGVWYLQGGWEGQLWTDAGGPIRNTGDLGFQGFSLNFGFNR
ncbi:MAG: hypothetical protein IID46_09765 [Planctomycetes bacterium]|nr:hypothetical protein [Planctomycetota bacterium]